MGVVPGKPLALPDPCTIVVRVQPWLLDGREQTVLAIDGGPTLWLTAEGAGLAIGGREVRVATKFPQDAGAHNARARGTGN